MCGPGVPEVFHILWGPDPSCGDCCFSYLEEHHCEAYLQFVLMLANFLVMFTNFHFSLGTVLRMKNIR